MYRSTQLDVITKHIGPAHMWIYAILPYLEKHGTPTQLEDLLDHTVVG